MNLQKFQDRNVYRNVMDSKDYYCVLIEDCREKEITEHALCCTNHLNSRSSPALWTFPPPRGRASQSLLSLSPLALCIYLNYTSHHPEFSQQRCIVSLPWPCPVLAICLSASVQDRPSLASHCHQIMGFDEGKLRWMFNLAPRPLVLTLAYFSYLTSRHSSHLPHLWILHFIHSQLVEVAHFFSPHLRTAVLHRTLFFPSGPTFIHPSGLKLRYHFPWAAFPQNWAR